MTFTNPYDDDELFYSVVARHKHYYKEDDTSFNMKMFGRQKVSARVTVPSYLDNVYEALGDPFTPDYVLEHCSVFKYYSSFASKDDVSMVINILRSSEGRRSAHLLGMNNNTLISNFDLMYCPNCACDDVEKHGETYFHITHNLTGIKVCSKCWDPLKPYPVDKSKRDYVMLDKDTIDINSIDIIKHYDKYLRLSIFSKEILSLEESVLDLDQVISRYKTLLLQNNLVYSSKRVKQKEIKKHFIDFYGNEFLKDISCEITDQESCWIRRITYKDPLHPLSPIQHLLIIGMFCNSIPDFIEIDNPIECEYPTKRAPGTGVCGDKNKLNNYKITLENSMERNPGWTRTEVHDHHLKEYSYIYNYDRMWLNNNLPPIKKTKNKKWDYHEKDLYYFSILQNEFLKLIETMPPVRLTCERLCAALNKHHISLIEKYPITSAFVINKVESAYQFRIRKCKYLVDLYYERGIRPEVNWIRLEAGISNYQCMGPIKDIITSYIEYKFRLH